MASDYWSIADNMVVDTVLKEPEIRDVNFIIKREIKMKVNDPRIFAKDRKDEDN